MNDESHPSRRNSPRIIGWVVACTALYVLSIGPVLAVGERSGLRFVFPRTPADEAYRTFLSGVYAPLNWMCDSSETFQEATNSYLSLWIDP